MVHACIGCAVGRVESSEWANHGCTTEKGEGRGGGWDDMGRQLLRLKRFRDLGLSFLLEQRKLVFG